MPAVLKELIAKSPPVMLTLPVTFRCAWCWQGSEDGHVRIWDIVEAKVTRVLKHHTRPVCSLSYHPDEPMLLTASYDGSAVLWGP